MKPTPLSSVDAEQKKHWTSTGSPTSVMAVANMKSEPSQGNHVPNISLHELRLDKSSTTSHRLWLFSLGLSALFDFMAAVIPRWMQVDHPTDTFTPAAWIVHVMQILDKYSIPVSILFSLLWFADAFVKANGTRDKKLRELDRQRLFGEVRACSEETIYLKGARGVYYRTMFVQLCFLPVGFYLLIWQFSRDAVLPRDLLLDEDEQVEIYFGGHTRNRGDHGFVTNTSQCLIFALARILFTYISKVSGEPFKVFVRGLGIRSSKRLAFFAIRNPKRFAARLRSTLTAIRWVKYLAPMIGTGNKLRENIGDLVKKYRQHREAALARNLRQKLWKEHHKDYNALREAAAIKVQSMYRAMQARKMLRALRMITRVREDVSAKILQRVMRTRLATVRARILLKKQELLRLQKKQALQKKNFKIMNVEDRRRMYELQDELKTEATELLNRRLLLRPNTTFSVTWKILFVVCVSFEIGQLAFSPILTKIISKETGKPMTIGDVLHSRFVPKPVYEWEICSSLPTQVKGPKIIRAIRKILPKRKMHNASDAHARQWFCRAPFSTAQVMSVRFLHFMVTEFLILVGIVCFLDVFVTFLTGEFSNEDGTLIPKPFVQRWILPGIALQLLVNPQMETTGKWVFRAMSNLAHFGPDRVWRWAAALFFPVIKTMIYVIKYLIWTPLVARQNSHTISINASSRVMNGKPANCIPTHVKSMPDPHLKIKHE